VLSVISLPSFETVLYNSKISFFNRWHLCANSLVAVHRTLNVIYCWLYWSTFPVCVCLVLCIFLYHSVLCVYGCLSVCLWLSLFYGFLTWIKRIDWLKAKKSKLLLHYCIFLVKPNIDLKPNYFFQKPTSRRFQRYCLPGKWTTGSARQQEFNKVCSAQISTPAWQHAYTINE